MISFQKLTIENEDLKSAYQALQLSLDDRNNQIAKLQFELKESNDLHAKQVANLERLVQVSMNDVHNYYLRLVIVYM